MIRGGKEKEQNKRYDKRERKKEKDQVMKGLRERDHERNNYQAKFITFFHQFIEKLRLF
jgi:hypothetical protein